MTEYFLYPLNPIQVNVVQLCDRRTIKMT